VSSLQHDFGFHFTGDFFQSFHGLGAKWFQDRNQNWFALFADGTLSSWKNEGGEDAFTPMATVDVALFANPQLLFQATVSLSSSAQDQLTLLEKANGFHFAGSFWQNFLGQNEKWFEDKTG